MLCGATCILTPIHLKLKSDVIAVWASAKKHGRTMVLQYYSAELSSNLETVLEWYRNNPGLIPKGMTKTKTNLVRLYRKMRVADLIGGENEERKAKFIYDLTRLVRCTFCTRSASLTFAARMGWTSYSPTITIHQCRTAIPSLRRLSSRLLSWAMASVEWRA